MSLVYDGEGFRVRPWHAGDVEALAAVANDFAVARYMSLRFPFPYSRANAEWWIAYVADPHHGVHEAIEIDGQIAGGIGVVAHEGERRHVAEIGYWLGPASWGSGVMTAAVRAFVPYAFETLGVRRLEAHVMMPNRASARVLEKAGFVHEATLLEWYCARDGALYDCLLYRMLRSEMPAAASQERTSS